MPAFPARPVANTSSTSPMKSRMLKPRSSPQAADFFLSRVRFDFAVTSPTGKVGADRGSSRLSVAPRSADFFLSRVRFDVAVTSPTGKVGVDRCCSRLSVAPRSVTGRIGSSCPRWSSRRSVSRCRFVRCASRTELPLANKDRTVDSSCRCARCVSSLSSGISVVAPFPIGG